MFDKVERNFRLLRSKLFEAFYRRELPAKEDEKKGFWYYPYVMQLKEKYGDTLREYIRESMEKGVEKGTFICADSQGNLKLGVQCWGTAGRVIIHNCVGYMPVGTFHVHPKYEPFFSTMDLLQGRTREEIACIGYVKDGKYMMKCLSPISYWRYPIEVQEEIDLLLSEVHKIINETNRLAEKYKISIGEAERIGSTEKLPYETQQAIREIWRLIDKYESIMKKVDLYYGAVEVEL